MSEENKLEIEFQKLNLEENDSLVIRLNTQNMDESVILEKLSEIRNDDFVKYIENSGHKVFVTYNGIKLEILRMEETDKLVMYLDTSSLKTLKEKEEYINYIKMKMIDVSEKLIVVPMDSPKNKIRTVSEGEEVSENQINLNDPVQVLRVPGGAEQPNFGFIPFPLVSNDKTISVNVDKVVFFCNPSDEFLTQYNTIFGKIISPTNKIII